MNATPKFGKVLLIAMMCTVAVACSKKVKEEPAPPPPSTVAPAPDTGPVTNEGHGRASCSRPSTST